VVDPLGRTVARIPEYAEGTATARVGLLKCRSVYAFLLGDRPWWLLLAVAIGSVAAGIRRRRVRPSPSPS
jgi:apolipoprotein N-acyltransferase